jgi:endonuclease YncB( thermonuclease family)
MSNDKQMRSRKLWHLAVVASFLFPILAFAGPKSITAKVMKVTDGDTIVVSPLDGGEFFKCRIWGIDAPEGKQAYGDMATAEMKKLVLGQVVHVETTGDLTHNREVCHISMNGRDINLAMIQGGHAWAYIRYLKKPFKDAYIQAEAEARTRRIGLWKDDHPIPPWEYRASKQSGTEP